MNESSEATHYQIELTSRQVLAALAVLLVCLFAAFFAGVWIGRNAEADQAALELAKVDEVSRGGERYDFFGKTAAKSDAEAGQPVTPVDGEASRSQDFAPGAASDHLEADALGPDPDDAELADEGDVTTMAGADPDALFEDDTFAEGGDQAATPNQKAGRAARRRRAAARAEQEATAVDEETSTAAPPDTETKVAGAAGATKAATPPSNGPAAAAGRPPAAAGESFHIQVLATSDRAKADALVKRLVDADFKAFIVPSNEGGRTVYRVRVGPFRDRALAAGQAQELERRWGLQSWISPGSP